MTSAAVDRGNTRTGTEMGKIGEVGWPDPPPLRAPELQLHLAPVLLGRGVWLFDRLHSERLQLEATGVIDSPKVTPPRHRVRTD